LEEIALEEMLQQMDTVSPFPHVTQPPSPSSDSSASDASSSAETVQEMSRTMGPLYSVDEIEQMLVGQDVFERGCDVSS
jgi:hypothetical protein